MTARNHPGEREGRGAPSQGATQTDREMTFGEAIKAKMEGEETWRERGAENDSTISPQCPSQRAPPQRAPSLDQAKLTEPAGRTTSWGKMGPRDEGRGDETACLRDPVQGRW